MLWQVALILSLVAANGFFVAAEFALVKVRLGEVRQLAEGGSRTARLLEHILGRLDAYLSACQLGITLASLGLGWLGEPLVARGLEPLFRAAGADPADVHYFSFPVAFLAITFLHITAGEQAPKILAIRKGMPTAQAISLPLLVFFRLFQPFIWFLNACSNLLLRVVGIRAAGGHADAPTEEQLRLLLVDSAAAGALTAHERRVIENVLDMEAKPARRYMQPRNQIVVIDRNDTMEQKLRQAAESGHTRLPLVDGDLDDVIGIVHVKDVFQAMVNGEELEALVPLAREALFLPETVPLDQVLHAFQQQRQSLALLLDEYGVVSGMITLEAVLGELVGPLGDEYRVDRPQIVQRGRGRYEVDGLCPLAELEARLGFDPGGAQVNTVGGLMTLLHGDIPVVGTTVTAGGYRFRVTAAAPTRVRRAIVERLPEAEPAPGPPKPAS